MDFGKVFIHYYVNFVTNCQHFLKATFPPVICDRNSNSKIANFRKTNWNSVDISRAMILDGAKCAIGRNFFSLRSSFFLKTFSTFSEISASFLWLLITWLHIIYHKSRNSCHCSSIVDGRRGKSVCMCAHNRLLRIIRGDTQMTKIIDCYENATNIENI